MAKKSWPKIGTVRKNDDGVSYIKLEDGVDIIFNGEKLVLNKSRTVRLDDPRQKLDFLLDNNYITEEDYDKRSEVLKNNQWLRFELVVPPAK